MVHVGVRTNSAYDIEELFAKESILESLNAKKVLSKDASCP